MEAANNNQRVINNLKIKTLCSLYPNKEILLDIIRSVRECLLPKFDESKIDHLDLLLSGNKDDLIKVLRDRAIDDSKISHKKLKKAIDGFCDRADRLWIKHGKIHFDLIELCFTMEEYDNHLSNLSDMVDNEMGDRGFVANEYFKYMHKDHPIYKALHGQISLSPETFELCNGEWSVLEGQRLVK